MKSLIASICVIIIFSVFSCNTGGPRWQELFNGEDLSGWVQKGGDATFEVVDNTIVGTSVMNIPNSFLCTGETYGDFILEYELKVDPMLNSGVQIRSHSDPHCGKGRSR